MITELHSDPGNWPAKSFSKFLNEVGEKILGGTAVASTWRLNAVRMIQRYGIETMNRTDEQQHQRDDGVPSTTLASCCGPGCGHRAAHRPNR